MVKFRLRLSKTPSYNRLLRKALPETHEGMKAFMDHLSFDKMKTNKAVNKDDFMTVSLIKCVKYYISFHLIYKS